MRDSKKNGADVLYRYLAGYDSESLNGLEDTIDYSLRKWEKEFGIETEYFTFSSRFRAVIETAYERTGEKVVVLVDEYDAPLVENMHDSAKFDYCRNLLKYIYVNLKVCDRYIRFGILTGGSRFSKMTVFCGLNNLRDISLLDQFSEICGITERELEAGFTQGIDRLASKLGTDHAGALAELKSNYDGYHFTSDCPDIYNPFSVLSALNDSCIRSYWFLSGTPAFLVRNIQRSGEFLPELFPEKVSDSELAQVDIHSTSPLAMMFQTGYLTIKDYDMSRRLYKLGIPSREVREGLFKGLGSLYPDKNQQKCQILHLICGFFWKMVRVTRLWSK